MPLVGLSLLLQVICVVHVIRTGRGMIWIYVIVFLPGAGCLAYLVAELLPSLFRSRTAHDLGSGARRILDPGRDLREARDRLEMADTIDNRRNYALACLAHGQVDEAIAMLEKSLVGMHADDPGLLSALAEAHFRRGDAARALELLDRLGAAGSQADAAELLRAQALEALGRDAEAAEQYRRLIERFPGEEVRWRYALLLERTGDAAGARALFTEIVDRQRRAPRYYRAEQREWVAAARAKLG